MTEYILFHTKSGSLGGLSPGKILATMYAYVVYRVSQKNIPHEYIANISSMIRNFFSKFYKLIIYPYLHLNSKF